MPPERLTKENMMNHKHSYIFRNWDQKIVDNIEFVEIIEQQGAIIGRVVFKQGKSNTNQLTSSVIPKETQFDKDNDAHKVKK